MTAAGLRDYCEHIEILRVKLAKAEAAAEKYYAAKQTGRDACELEILRDLAINASEVNEGGDLRMALLDVFDGY